MMDLKFAIIMTLPVIYLYVHHNTLIVQLYTMALSLLLLVFLLSEPSTDSWLLIELVLLCSLRKEACDTLLVSPCELDG